MKPIYYRLPFQQQTLYIKGNKHDTFGEPYLKIKPQAKTNVLSLQIGRHLTLRRYDNFSTLKTE